MFLIGLAIGIYRSSFSKQIERDRQRIERDMNQMAVIAAETGDQNPATGGDGQRLKKDFHSISLLSFLVDREAPYGCKGIEL
jgi:hypothetical protein